MIRLGPTLGKGGEGTVHAVESDTRLAAKIYLPGLAAERRPKILKMAEAKLHASASFVAFPIDPLFDQAGAFAGFTMLKMANRAPVHKLYSPTSRKVSFPRATYPLLLRAVANVASAVASVHASGCVIGDINHSGVLVSDDATVVMIDSDSFQFSYGGQLYPCKVGVPEFTPPELQGKSLATIVRTSTHDGFGLAVLIFYTLMMGRHPFAGRYLGSDDMPMERAISEFRFAYSNRRAVTKMEPPPNVPLLTDLPSSLGVAFERAFGPDGATKGRTSAKEWVTLLDRAEGELIPCAQAPAHHYFRSAASCPWCRMERAYPGFRAFAPTFPTRPGNAPIDLGQLISTVRGVPDPGPAPDIHSLMPAVPAAQLRQPTTGLRKARLVRRAAAIVILTIGLCCLPLPFPGPLVGLIAVAASAVLGFRPPPSLASLSKSNQQAQRSWNDAKRTFSQSAGNEYFLRLRADAEALIQTLQQNMSEETRRLSDLTTRQQDAQLRQHLESHDVDQVKIKGIGAARKLTLKSYGIETAADVSYNQIIAIYGFGPAAAKKLLAWRRSLEASFSFDPSKGVNPLDVSVIKADIAQRNAAVEARLLQTIPQLRKASSDAFAIRSNPGQETIRAWTDWKQAEFHEKELSPSTKELAPLVVLASVGMLALTVVTQLSRGPQGFTHVLSNSMTNVIGTPANVQTEPARKSPALPTTLPHFGSPTSVPLPSPIPSPTPSTTAAFAQPAITEQPVPTALPSPAEMSPSAPIDVRPTPLVDALVAPVSPTGDAKFDLLNRVDARRVERRLKALGYFGGAPEGFWGSKSRAALRQFRRTQGLGNDDRWDAQTEGVLMSDKALRAVRSAQLEPNVPEVMLPAPVGTLRNPLNRPDAIWAQSRLRELGFYSGPADGSWGLASRTALEHFKQSNGVGSNDVWDGATEQRLGGQGPTQPNQAFEGGWAPKLGGCGDNHSTPPVTISARRAEAFGGFCDFENVQRDGSGWRIQGECASDGKSWHADIQLTISGTTLTWSSQRGVAKYVRCR